MEFIKLCEKSHELAAEVMKSDSFVNLMKAKESINTELAAKVEAFNVAKDKYSEVCKYGKYHPDYDKARKELIKTKEELYSEELYIEYKKYEKEIQKQLDEISSEIEKTINL